MHNHSKFHEKQGFRLEQIRQKQAKGFGRTPSFRHDIGFRLEQIRLKQTKRFRQSTEFRHDIGFRMRQMLYFRHFKPPNRANRGSCRTTKGYWVSDGHQWLADVAIYARKSEGFGFILRSFVLLNHRPPHQASHHATPDPSGGNAAVVRDKKVMSLSVLPDIRRTTFSIPYLCHTYLNKRECCQTYSNLDCH